MQREEENASTLLEIIRREMASIIDEGTEDYECKLNEEKKTSQSCDGDKSEFCSSNTSSLKNNILNISNIDECIQELQNNLDESHKTFQAIGESFENINFGCLKDRIKDLHLNEPNADSIKIILNDLKQSFDKKYMENRLDELTREVSSKFRDHPEEFGDIPEISEFCRTCSKLEHELVKLRKQRDDCVDLQKRMTRVADASYERVYVIQQKIIGADEQ